MPREQAPVPLLSVVVPVYGVEEYLSGCLDSILTGAGTDLEVVAVDDRSPDRSGEIADAYARRDPRVRVVHLPGNRGLGGARNAGLDRATGEFVWFVDSDDWLLAGAVRAVVERLSVRWPDVLVVDHQEVFEGGQVRSSQPGGALADPGQPIGLAQRPELLRLAHSACTKVVRREFVREAGLRFAAGWYEDTVYSHSMLMAAERIDTLDRVCYCYRQRPSGGITKTAGARHFEVFDQYQRLFEFVEKAAPKYDQFRPVLFRSMIDHYLVIVGNESRLPAHLRRAFFRRMAGDFRSRLPAGGYDVPGGVAGGKHRLVRHDAYLPYAVLRAVYRMVGGRAGGR